MIAGSVWKKLCLKAIGQAYPCRTALPDYGYSSLLNHSNIITIALIFRVNSNGARHMAPILRGEEVFSIGHVVKQKTPDVWLVFRRGQDPTWTEASLTTGSNSPPLLHGSTVLPAVPGLPSKSTSMRCPVVNQLLSEIVTRTAAQVPPELQSSVFVYSSEECHRFFKTFRSKAPKGI